MKITVLILAYNEEKFIERCLRSVFSQVTNFDYEVIVVNDASEDATAAILTKSPFPITVLTNEKNLGIGYSAGLGLQHSTGQYFVRIDGDDYVSEYLLQTLGICIVKRKVSAVSCDYNITDSDSNVIGYGDSQKKPIACGVLYNKDALIEVGGYDASFRIYEDVELRERFSKVGKVINIPIPLYNYRAHGNNSTGLSKVLSHSSK